MRSKNIYEHLYGGLRRFEARETTKRRIKFDEITIESEKNGNLIQTKKAPRWKGFWGLKFLSNRF